MTLIVGMFSRGMGTVLMNSCQLDLQTMRTQATHSHHVRPASKEIFSLTVSFLRSSGTEASRKERSMVWLDPAWLAVTDMIADVFWVRIH